MESVLEVASSATGDGSEINEGEEAGDELKEGTEGGWRDRMRGSKGESMKKGNGRSSASGRRWVRGTIPLRR